MQVCSLYTIASAFTNADWCVIMKWSSRAKLNMRQIKVMQHAGFSFFYAVWLRSELVSWDEIFLHVALELK